MSDIFNRDVSKLGGVFTADRAKLIFGADNNIGALVQNMSTQYDQNITRLYEVGGPHIYYVGGRTQGQMQVGHVVGPKPVIQAFYAKYGDVCCPQTITFRLEESNCLVGCPGHNPTTPNKGQLTLALKNSVLTSIGFSVQAQDMIIGENSTLIFSSLELDG